MPRRILAKVRKWTAGKKTIVVLLAGVGISVVMLILVTTTLVHTSSEAFCATDCHEMNTTVNAEYKGTVHDKNRTGVRATCPDCHVPNAPVPLYIKKMGAVNDLWGHYITHSIDTKEKFEAKRQVLAERVWTYMKGNDSRECRYCHTVKKMDPERQSETARSRHAKARKEKLSCIDCHFGIAHTVPVGGPGPQELEVERSFISKEAIF